jgi:hypothetical protein
MHLLLSIQFAAWKKALSMLSGGLSCLLQELEKAI